MNLTDAVRTYRQLTGGFGRPVALASFGYSPEQTERLFSGFDEDYHISRFFHFTLDPELVGIPGKTYQINGFPQSHVSVDAEIETIL